MNKPISQQMALCILTMRNGDRISCSTFGDRWLYIGSCKMHNSTFDALFKRGIIEYDTRDNYNNYYKLTELGKTITL